MQPALWVGEVARPIQSTTMAGIKEREQEDAEACAASSRSVIALTRGHEKKDHMFVALSLSTSLFSEI